MKITTLTLQNIENETIQASFQSPVLIVFWAAQIPQSQALLQLIEKLIPELTLKVTSANLEEMPQIAQYFGVSALPALKIIHQGQLVADSNEATPDEASLRHFLKDYLKKNAHPEIQQCIAEGDLERARNLAESALLNDSKNEVILLDLAEIFLAQKAFENAQALLKQEFTAESKRAESLLKRLRLLKNAPDIESLKNQIDQEPENLELHLDLARALVANNDAQSAFDSALFVLQQDKTNTAAKKTLLELFAALEGENFEDLIRQKRRQMARILN